MVDKNLVATTVSSREKGMSRRKQQVTTSSHNDKTKEDRRRIKVCFSSKDKGRKYLKHEGEGTMNCDTAANGKGEAKSSGSSKVKEQMREETTSSPVEKVKDVEQQEENKKREEFEGPRKSGSNTGLPSKTEMAKPEEITLTVLQKNTRSMSTSERFEELVRGTQGAKWDVRLTSETWRPNQEVWESEQGHIVMESSKFSNKHGVAIIVNCRWKKQDQLGGLRKRESDCSIDIGQQTTDNSDQHVHATHWLSRPPYREDIRYHQQSHW